MSTPGAGVLVWPSIAATQQSGNQMSTVYPQTESQFFQT
jgi:hypothetical protein